jgi:hypothetical protein
VITINSGAKQRTQALKMSALALRMLAAQNLREEEQMDLGAYILENLKIIATTIDQAASAWEKRDYWVKADHFRMEWRWLDRIVPALETALRSADKQNLAVLAAEVAGKIGSTEPPKRLPAGSPWVGALRRFHSR